MNLSEGFRWLCGLCRGGDPGRQFIEGALDPVELRGEVDGALVGAGIAVEHEVGEGIEGWSSMRCAEREAPFGSSNDQRRCGHAVSGLARSRRCRKGAGFVRAESQRRSRI